MKIVNKMFSLTALIVLSLHTGMFAFSHCIKNTVSPFAQGLLCGVNPISIYDHAVMKHVTTGKSDSRRKLAWAGYATGATVIESFLALGALYGVYGNYCDCGKDLKLSLKVPNGDKYWVKAELLSFAAIAGLLCAAKARNIITVS
jgi:hypothetical protein